MMTQLRRDDDGAAALLLRCGSSTMKLLLRDCGSTARDETMLTLVCTTCHGCSMMGAGNHG